MFDLFNQISQMLSGPIHGLAYGFMHIPLLFSFFLGLVGAVAPCQLTSNVSAITIYGNRSLVDRVPWLHITLFILGKIVVFFLLGIIIWLLGNEVNNTLVQFFPVLRKTIGPLLIIIGLIMIGVFKFNKSIGLIRLPDKLKDSYIGSFLLGVSFTLAFCPTMFILFFVTLMPVVLTTSYGVLLPSIFGIGTSFPLLLVIFLIWYFGASGAIMKKSRKVGAITQKLAGGLLLIIGIFDSLTYLF
ncbi:urease accessory protein UreH domain-containing protein [Cytobacillus horneckiae]|uniref:Sulfite exporter TauE/SafE family protein n=1 Tax=Cytobacillus horneckiae TaxID=549687 RepID=A0A2N0ZH36_9BACI|nr:sulfite exporter TauE/SafE family protein [Cytobacillus horneckiae]MEC1158625.1 sulfite exporter TauE/SafE family protein [Cytobacillus horneckiae]MED2939187.1 sulfite exporter TauE/SafE family protein [Cytobacillus horneckiae]PKG28827.1 sulfite exporter TauE/SafE family protein [Cytobacillus horneckiae]